MELRHFGLLRASSGLPGRISKQHRINRLNGPSFASQATPRQSSLYTSFRTKTGGGGGSRTRVRRSAIRNSTCLSRDLNLAFGHAHGRAYPRASSLCLISRPQAQRETSLFIGAPDVVQATTPGTWLLVRQPGPIQNWQLRVCCLFYEPTAPRHALPDLDIPVETERPLSF